MKQFVAVSIAVVSFSAFPLQASAANAADFIELAYSEVNPDWKPYSNGSGVRVLGEYRPTSHVFLFGSYNSAELLTSGPVLSRYKTAEHWRIAGSGAELFLSDAIALQAALSWQAVDLGGRARDGYGIHGGMNLRLASWLDFRLDVAYVDLVVDDIALSADLAFRFHDRAAVTLRIHDHSDWDFTAYEAGLRFYF